MKANDIPGLAVAISLKENRITSAMGWPRRGRPPGDAGDPVRDRLGEQDLHRHPRRLCPDPRTRCASTTAPASTGRHCRAAASTASACSTSRPTAGGFAAAVPRLGAEGPGTDPRLLPPVAADLRAGQPAPLFQPEHRPVRLSRRAQLGQPFERLMGNKCSRHWASNRPTSTCPRRWRSTPGLWQGRPPATGRSRPAGCRRLRGEDQRGRPAALRRCQPASGAPGQALGAGARCHPSRLLQGRRHDPGPGLGSLRLADLPEAPAGQQLDADGAATTGSPGCPRHRRWRASAC